MNQCSIREGFCNSGAVLLHRAFCRRRLEALIFQNTTLCVSDREARADRQRGELINCITAGEPVRKLVFVEAFGHARVPFAGGRADHRAGVELATIDTHRAAEVTADVESRLDDGVAGETWRHRFEIGDFSGQAAAGHTVPPRWSSVAILNLCGTTKRSCLHGYA